MPATATYMAKGHKIHRVHVQSRHRYLWPKAPRCIESQKILVVVQYFNHYLITACL